MQSAAERRRLQFGPRVALIPKVHHWHSSSAAACMMPLQNFVVDDGNQLPLTEYNPMTLEPVPSLDGVILVNPFNGSLSSNTIIPQVY